MSTSLITNTLPETIRQFIPLGKQNSQGWFSVACKVCNDHTRKGLRAGFKLDGHTAGYNCYNCGISAAYDPTLNRNLSKNMVTILEAFGVPETEWKKVALGAMLTTPEDSVREERNLLPNTIPTLPFFYPLVDDSEDDWCQYSIDYLTNRGIDWTKYPFFCVHKTNHPDNAKWYGRLIIPVYKNDNLIFYQGRDLTDMHVKKYLSATTPRDAVMYGYDQLMIHSNKPLYIVEGFFDAFALDGVALFGNKLTPTQIYWLSRCNRPKTVIPDRIGDGHLLANKAIELGWNISTLDIGDDCKDVNQSIVTHGLLYTISTIVNNTVSGAQASVRVNAYCKGASNV